LKYPRRRGKNFTSVVGIGVAGKTFDTIRREGGEFEQVARFL